MPASTRDPLLDVLKGLMIIFVIALHTGWEYIDPARLGVDFMRHSGHIWATWLFGWMNATYFFIGGALAVRAVRRETAGSYMRKRLKRLMLPYWAVAAVLAVIDIALWAGSYGPCAPGKFTPIAVLSFVLPWPALECLHLARWPFWFIFLYVPMTLAAPVLHAIYRRRALCLAGMAGIWVLTAFFDQFFYEGSVPGQKTAIIAGLANFLAVWTWFFVLGFFYADGVLQRWRRYLVPVGLLLLAAAVALGYGPYKPDFNSNMLPPSLMMLCIGTGAICLFIGAHQAVVRFGEARAVKPVLSWTGARVYTLYLWHMVVFEVVWYGLLELGAVPAIYGLPFWVQRLFWFAAVWVLLIPTVRLVYPIEQLGLGALFPSRRRKPAAQPQPLPAGVAAR